LAYQLALRGSCDGRTAEMFGEAVMAELWDSVGTPAMARTHKAQEEASGRVRCSHWVHYKLVETIEKPCNDFLVHTSEVCMGIPSVQWVSDRQG
jgi:hypothetical protein